MKKIVLLLALFFCVSFAQTNNYGLGVWVGGYNNRFGLDLKHLNDNNTAWDIYLGDFRIGDQSAIGFSGGYYFMFPNIIKADASAGSFPLYWGPNIGIGYWSGSNYDGFDIGINIVGGVSWFTPTSFKMDVSFEVLSPSVGMWRQNNRDAYGNWRAEYNPAFGLKDYLGIRLLFHAYFF